MDLILGRRPSDDAVGADAHVGGRTDQPITECRRVRVRLGGGVGHRQEGQFIDRIGRYHWQLRRDVVR